MRQNTTFGHRVMGRSEGKFSCLGMFLDSSEMEVFIYLVITHNDQRKGIPDKCNQRRWSRHQESWLDRASASQNTHIQAKPWGRKQNQVLNALAGDVWPLQPPAFLLVLSPVASRFRACQCGKEDSDLPLVHSFRSLQCLRCIALSPLLSQAHPAPTLAPL